MMKMNKNKNDEEEGLKTRNNRRFFKRVLKENATVVFLNNETE